MNLKLVMLIVIAVIVIAGYLLYKKKKNELTLAEIREKALMLFLFAEKQDWINEDKWSWCVKQIYDLIPAPVLKKFIKYETVDEFMDKLYVEFKKYLNSNILKIQ